ncbi:hypothetical protein SARC_13899, partial [Sphaeroforma arctica JP610]
MTKYSTTNDFMTQEERSMGKLGWPVLRSYMAHCGGVAVVLGYFLFLVLERSTFVVSDWWLAMWASAETAPPDDDIARAFNLPAANTPEGSRYYSLGYTGLAALNTVFVFGRCQLWALAAANSSRKLFVGLLK